MSKNVNMTMSNMFRTEDITFHGGREQKEILNEGVVDDETSTTSNVSVPVSATLESCVRYFSELLENSTNPQERNVYRATIGYLQEVAVLKSKITKLTASRSLDKKEE